MKLILKNPASSVNEKLSIIQKEVPCLDASWHYHREYELLFISQGSGIRFVGDGVAEFAPGDLVLVGPYLPHLWRNDPAYSKAGKPVRKVNTIVIKFLRDFMGTDTFDLPQFSSINSLLEESKFGVSFGSQVSLTLKKKVLELANSSPAAQAIGLMDILLHLSMSSHKNTLSSTDMRQYTDEHAPKIDSVIKFISDNYDEYITLNDVADIACLTPNSFCRFFKRMTNKSFTQFLNEVRIRNAARLLIQESYPISEICYMVGYRSITNFNRQFKEIMGVTPKQYRLNPN